MEVDVLGGETHKVHKGKKPKVNEVTQTDLKPRKHKTLD